MRQNYHSYNYTVLRYMHDTVTGEFINVGLVLYSKDEKFIGARFLTSIKRITSAFPGASGHKIRSILHKIDQQFENNFSSGIGQIHFNKYETAIDVAKQVFPGDDSSLQWSDLKTGRAASLEDELSRMFHRLVEFYVDEHVRQRRDEKDIWKSFSSDLKVRNLERYFSSATISTADDEVNFEHTWKNGKLHCIQPLSFDYASPESIKDKAHKWLGQMTSISAADKEFKLYFLIGEPSSSELTDAFESAVSILEKIPGDKMLFMEKERRNLLDVLEGEVRAHYSNMQ